MPYIPRDERAPYLPYLQALTKEMDGKPQGHLTYILFYLIREWIFGQGKQGQSYNHISQGIAAATDAAAEVRRKDMDPYEDKKEKENGEV